MNKTPLVLPELCLRHRIRAVKDLQIPESGPWRAALITLTLLLFQAWADDPHVQKAADGKVENLGALMGGRCLACQRQAAFTQAVEVIARRGIEDATRIARSERDDPLWPHASRTRAMLNPHLT